MGDGRLSRPSPCPQNLIIGENMATTKTEDKFIHSGSTLFNLALTGNIDKGWSVGRVSNIIGDKSTGKTLLAIEAAKIFLDIPFGKVKPMVTYIETEAAFDKEYAQRLGLDTERVEFVHLQTIEELYEVLSTLCTNAKKDEAHFVVLDSFDALSCQAELEKSIDAGSYGMEKQKKAGEVFRKLISPMEQANISLFLISQVRDNIGGGLYAPKFKRSGGKALDFYSTNIVWLAEKGKLKMNQKSDRPYGIEIKANVTKNKVGNPFRSCEFPILFEYGIDDIFSIIKFLADLNTPVEHRIKKLAGGYYLLPDTEEKLRMQEAITYVESNPEVYRTLRKQTQAAWDALEDLNTVKRKNKSELLRDANKK